MALTDDIARIDKAIALGVLSVQVEGKSLTFDDFDGLRARRQLLVDQLAAASGQRRRRYRRAYYSMGLR